MSKPLFPKLFSFFLSSSFLTVGAFGQTTPGITPMNGSTVLAEVDGVKLTLADFERRNPSGFFHARNVYYEAQRKVIEQAIDEIIVERQAQKEGLTVEQLLKKHLEAEVEKVPSEEALRVYFEGVETTQPYEAVRGQIIESIRQRRLTKARTAYVQSLHNQAKIAMFMSAPRADVDLKNAAVRGPADAPVLIVEYADYECPYCQQIQPALDKIEAEYKGKLKFAYKDVPLPNHAHAQKAAEAAQCAGVQGKYWEFHDILFSTKQLELPQLKQYARDLKLDTKAFDACLDSGERAPLIRPIASEAQGFGMQGTPSFFINGRFFGNGSSYEELKRIIDEELAKRNATTATR